MAVFQVGAKNSRLTHEYLTNSLNILHYYQIIFPVIWVCQNSAAQINPPPPVNWKTYQTKLHQPEAVARFPLLCSYG